MAHTGRIKKSSRLLVITGWILVAVLSLGSSVLALNVTTRVRRVLLETNQVRDAVQQAVKRQEMVVKAPARREFSSAFLQMAFGDNPVLLEQVKGQLQQAISDKPSLQQGEVAMMLVTYRAEGEIRDVAIQVFGQLNVERMPAFSTEGYWKGQLPEQFYRIGQSWLALFGRDVLILANQGVRKQQQEVLDATKVPWSIQQLGARAEYRFVDPAPRNGGESAAAHDAAIEEYLHLFLSNRGVLITPFHNMALMCPTTTAADVDRHSELFSQAVAELIG